MDIGKAFEVAFNLEVETDWVKVIEILSKMNI